jgi:hypothetical protein
LIRFLGTALALAALPLATSCAGPACGKVAGFEIYLEGGRPALEGGVLTLCRNGACNDGMAVWEPVWQLPHYGWEHGQFALSGALSTTATSALVFVRPDGRATIDAGIPMEQSSGDGFDLRFVDAQGATQLDFSRHVLYEMQRSCPVGATRVWPSSPSGLTCAGRTCASGAKVTADATLPDASSDGVTAEICRNDLCSTLVRRCRNDACVPDDSPGFMGGLDAWLEAVPLGQNAWEFRVDANDNPAVLSDGDRYRLTITDRNGSVVAAVDKTVVYQQAYPNGTDCDPYPCRWADVGP